MKHMFSAALCGALVALAIGSSAQTFQPGVATVVRIQGEARYSLGDGNWHPLVVGKILSPGALIQTAHDAFVDVVLGKYVQLPQANQWPDRVAPAPDSPVRGMIAFKPSAEQNMVRLTGDTVLGIDKLTVSDTGVDAISDTELNLKQGRIFCSVKKLSAASQYLVKIPNGIAGVRGTLFEISADGRCAVIKNAVLLSIIGSNGQPQTYTVGEGSLFDPTTGQITPLPPDLINLLNQVATALDTLYVEVVSFTHDRTTCFISPTSGNDQGENNNNQGQNNNNQ